MHLRWRPLPRHERPPSQGAVVDTVAALHDSNARPAKSLDIYYSNVFQCNRPPCHISSSQKFHQETSRRSTAQSRLKLLLDTLAAEDDCDVMVFHDQMGVTCGIVVQTATQKLAFKQWGETLAMDWTHGTNNVG
ncbi:hypothetical protein GQ600_18047 [Phytophthora cactorum]|nr:hypothetical protein GQ600_18047 [Phytophthora cactorum]